MLLFENYLIFKNPTPLVHLHPKYFHPLDLGRPNLNEILPTLSRKLWNNNRTVHVNERNQNKSKTKSRHIQVDHALFFSIYPTNNAVVSLKDGFTLWHQYK